MSLEWYSVPLPSENILAQSWCAGQDFNLQRPTKGIQIYSLVESTVSPANARVKLPFRTAS